MRQIAKQMEAQGNDESKRVEGQEMITTTTRLMLNQFLALPEKKPYLEFAAGDAVPKPMPDKNHSRMQGILFLLLRQFLQETRLGEVLTEWRCIFGPPGGERALIADLTYASRAAMAESDRTGECYLRVAPDLAIEILSLDQSASRFADKLAFYLSNEVRLVWVIDPESKTVSTYSPGAQPRTLRAGEMLDGSDVLPGFSLAVTELFAELENEL